MKFARIISREADEALSLLADEDISAVERAEERRAERDDIDRLLAEEWGAEVPEIDAVIEEAEREWISAGLVESFRVSRDLTDGARAHRARRRTTREVLRTLHEGFLIGGMPGQGKSSIVAASLLDMPVTEGEAA
jgi:hypothetical protein